MKITKKYLNQIIKEELEKELDEKLLFDADKSKDKEYIEVYRLDKDFGGRGWLGPNSMKASDMWLYDNGEGPKSDKKRDELLDLYGILIRTANRRPAPATDFTAKEWEPVTWSNKKHAHKRPLYFAFKSPEDAKKWFGKTEIAAWIHMFGFHLRKIKAKRAWISKSGKQVIFEPLTSLEDGEIIN